MSTTYAHSSITTQKLNNAGTVIQAGNTDTTGGPITNDLSLVTLADHNNPTIGSKVLANDGTGASTTDRVGISGAIATGTLAYNPTNDQFVIRGGVTSSLNNGAVTDNTLLSAGSNYTGNVRTSIHKLTTTRTLGSGLGTYNVYAVPSTQITPNYTKGGGSGSSQAFVAPSGAGDQPATDDAAAPTRSVPGELTIHFGQLGQPTNDEYKASDSYES